MDINEVLLTKGRVRQGWAGPLVYSSGKGTPDDPRAKEGKAI